MFEYNHATSAEAEAVARAESAGCGGGIPWPRHPGAAGALAGEEHDVGRLATQKQSAVIVCRYRDSLVGCSWVARRDGIHSTDCYFGGLFVAAPRLGIGQELTRRCIAQAGVWGSTALLAELVRGHHHLASLQRHGFQVRGEHPGRTFTEARWLELVLPMIPLAGRL